MLARNSILTVIFVLSFESIKLLTQTRNGDEYRRTGLKPPSVIITGIAKTLRAAPFFPALTCFEEDLLSKKNE